MSMSTDTKTKKAKMTIDTIVIVFFFFGLFVFGFLGGTDIISRAHCESNGLLKLRYTVTDVK